MSYDLMVFEKTKAPTTKKEFMAWYEKQCEWSEEHDYRILSCFTKLVYGNERYIPAHFNFERKIRLLFRDRVHKWAAAK